MPIDEEEFTDYNPFDPERRSTGSPSPIKRITKAFPPVGLLDPLLNYYYRAKPGYNQIHRNGVFNDRKYYEWQYKLEDEGTEDQNDQQEPGIPNVDHVRYANRQIEQRPDISNQNPALVFDAGNEHLDASVRTFPSFNLLDKLGEWSPTPMEIWDSLPSEIISLGAQKERLLTDEERRFGLNGDLVLPERIFEFTPAGTAFRNAVRQALGEAGFALPYTNTFENISEEHLFKGIFSTRQIDEEPGDQPGDTFTILSPANLNMLIGYYIDFTEANNILGHLRDTAFIKALRAFYIAEGMSTLGGDGVGVDRHAIGLRFLEPFYKEYEYYDFKTEVPFLVDFVSFHAINGLTRQRDANLQFTEDAATIKPNYNYYSPDYESVLQDVPETALPNMYVYSFASDKANGSAPKWQNGETQENEIKNGYDKVIRIGEFVSGTLPRLANGNSREFRRYLKQYARGVKNAIVDFTSPAAKAYYETRDSLSNNLISPASEMGFYDKLNHRKNMFPMYIEMNIPTLNIGPIGELIERTKSSTSCLNSLITGIAQAFVTRPTFDFQTDCITQPGAPPAGTAGYDANVRSIYHGSTSSPYGIFKRKWSQESTVHEVDRWLAATQENIDAQVVSEEGQERLAGQCPGLVDRTRFQAIRSSIASESRAHLLDWETILEAYTDQPGGGSDPSISCKTETIAYKLVKKYSRNNQVIQNFYFSNTSKEDIIKFVDTQVKPIWAGGTRAEYQYELYAYAIVYGSKFRFRYVDDQLQAVELPNRRFSPVYSKFSVETIPNPKIIEYPIFTTQQANPHAEGGDRPAPGYGVSYPPVHIDHRPPTSPDMRITPYKGNYRQILLNFSVGTGEFIGKDAIPAITLSEDEYEQAQQAALYQLKFLNYSLTSPELEFSSEGGDDVTAIEVYRAEELLQNPQSRQALYRGFEATPHKVLNIGTRWSPAPPEEEAKAFDFVDTIKPNRKYYYTCRSIDLSGHRSNPGEIYEVELVYNDGIYYPIIKVYQPNLTPPRKLSRQLIRYLEIKPAEIQTHVETHLEDGILESTMGLTNGPEDEPVEGKKFLVRVTSRDTGRKFDINLSFKKTQPN